MDAGALSKIGETLLSDGLLLAAAFGAMYWLIRRELSKLAADINRLEDALQRHEDGCKTRSREHHDRTNNHETRISHLEGKADGS